MKSYRFGSEIMTKHFYNPGEHLSEFELRKLFQTIQKINNSRPTPIQHPYLKLANGETLKAKFSNQFLGLIYVDDVAMGFIFSPIIPDEKLKIVHAGLVVMCNKKRKYLIPLLSLCQTDFVGRKFPDCFITNISSTPSVIECFARASDKTWPDPRADLTMPPKKYEQIFDILNERYTDKFLRTSAEEKIIIDRKRFVIRTASQKMGFNTNPRELSRSQNFEYINFCLAWLDYDKEEDIVQVGLLNFKARLKIKKYLLWAKLGYMRQGKDQKGTHLEELVPHEATHKHSNAKRAG